MKDQKKLNAPYFRMNCCFECKRRKVGCHSSCRLYQGYSRENERRKKLLWLGNATKDENYLARGRK